MENFHKFLVTRSQILHNRVTGGKGGGSRGGGVEGGGRGQKEGYICSQVVTTGRRREAVSWKVY